MVYNRDETVAAVASYYKFLTKVHLDESDIRWPPPGGWPHLTDDCLSKMGKNHVVNDLIRHLPYVKSGRDSIPIYYKTSVVDFAGAFPTPLDASNFEPQPSLEVCAVPPHVLTLAESVGREGFFFMLDTERGTMIMHNYMYNRKPTELSEDVDSLDEDNWAGHATYRIGDFFTMLEDEFRNFEIIAYNPLEMSYTDNMDPDKVQKIKDVFHEHGFLTENYRKSECLEKVFKIWADLC